MTRSQISSLKQLTLAFIFLLLPTLAHAYELDGLAKDSVKLKACLEKSDFAISATIKSKPRLSPGTDKEIYQLELTAGEILYKNGGVPANQLPKPGSDLQFVLAKENVAGLAKGQPVIILLNVKRLKLPYYVFSDDSYGIQKFSGSLATSIRNTPPKRK